MNPYEILLDNAYNDGMLVKEKPSKEVTEELRETRLPSEKT